MSLILLVVGCHFRKSVVPRFSPILVAFCERIALCVRTSMRSQHVLPPQDLGRARLPADRREPPRRRPGASASDRDTRAFRGIAGERPAGTAGALGRPLCGQGPGLSAASDEAAVKVAVRRIGPALVFERLWEETGCRAVIAALAGQRKHGFALERAVFLTVLHRLF